MRARSTAASAGRRRVVSSRSLAPAARLHVARHVQPAARQSRPKSCQKFVELQRRAQRVRRSLERVVAVCRRCAARAGRPDWPIGGSSRTRRPTRRSGSSWYPDRTRSPDRRTTRSADRAIGSNAPRAATIRSSCSCGAPVAPPRRRRAACSRRCQASSCARPFRRRRGAFVGDVVGDARERIDRRDVRTHRRGQQPRRHRKILVMRPRQRLACRVRARKRLGPGGSPTHNLAVPTYA